MGEKKVDFREPEGIGVPGSHKELTRREALKYAAAAAAVAGTVKMGLLNDLLEPQTVSAGLNQDEFLENGAGEFAVDIPGLPVASANIQSISVEDLTIDVRETTTEVDWDFRTFAPGDAHYGKATFKSRVLPESKELLQWLEDASVGKNVRKNITVILKARDGSEARRWNLMECFPIKYDPGDYSPSSTTRLETIVVKIGHVEFA